MHISGYLGLVGVYKAFREFFFFFFNFCEKWWKLLLGSPFLLYPSGLEVELTFWKR